MSDYMRNRGGDEGDGFFCRFTFGQFFALLVLEVFTLFFVFYLGARYGQEFLGLKVVEAGKGDQGGGEGAGAPKVATTDDPEARELAKELIAKAQTPELKERISRMFEGAKGAGTPPPVVGPIGDEGAGASGQARAIERGQASGGAESVALEGAATAPRESDAGPTPGRTEAGEDSAAAEVRRQQRPGGPATAGPPGAGAPAAGPPTAGLPTAGPPTAGPSGVVRVKSGEDTRYSLQIGSYPNMDEASRVVERWKGKGYSAYMMIADIPDRGRWYRVRIGGFGTHEDAARYLKEFQVREDVEALIVMNEQ